MRLTVRGHFRQGSGDLRHLARQEPAVDDTNVIVGWGATDVSWECWMPEQRQRARRRLVGRLAAVLAGATTLGLVSAAALPAGAADDFQNGRASAIAQSYKVNPTTSGLSIGVTFGLALSDYTNNVSRAESRAIDLGVVGTTLAAAACDGGDPTLPREDQPQRLFVDSRDEGAAQGKTEQEKYAPAITKSARANDTPESEAITTTAPIAIPGVLDVSGARSRTLTRVVDGKVREALATTDIASLSLGGGAVQLRGLHWESRHLSGGDAKPTASFSIADFLVNGKPQPVPSDPKVLADAVNRVTGNLGVVVRLPAFRSDNGIQFVEPLAIAVVPNATRDGLVQPLLDAVYPGREALYAQLLEISCKFGSAFISPSDILIASLTGAGQFSIELGGVQATSGALETTSFLDQFADAAANVPTVLPASGDLALGSGGFDGSLGSTGVSGGGPTGAPSSGTAAGGAGGTATPVDAVPASVTPGSRGGKLAAVALGVLALVALLAAADRHAILRGRRTIPPEAP